MVSVPSGNRLIRRKNIWMKNVCCSFNTDSSTGSGMRLTGKA